MLLIEKLRNPPADRAQIMDLEHGVIVLGQQVRSDECHLPRAHAPADEQLAQSNEQEHVLDVLNGERKREVRRGAIQNQRCGPAVLRQDDGQEEDEEHRAADGQQAGRTAIGQIPECSPLFGILQIH